MVFEPESNSKAYFGYLKQKRCGSDRFSGQLSRRRAREVISPPAVGAHRAEVPRRALSPRFPACPAPPAPPPAAPARPLAPATERESGTPLCTALHCLREVASCKLRARGKRSLFVDHPSSGPLRPQIVRDPSPTCPRSFERCRKGLSLHRARTTFPPSFSPSSPFRCKRLAFLLQPHPRCGWDQGIGATRVWAGPDGSRA